MAKDTLLVVFGDTHCGSTRGLMPAKGIIDVDGNLKSPNPLQKIILQQWNECWDSIKAQRKGKRLVLVCLGDMVEGIHHGTTQIVSSRVETHENIAIDMFDDAFTHAGYNPDKGDLLFFIAGTEEHVGAGSQSEERIAKDFDGAIPDEQNSRFTWETLQLDINGVLIDFAHHGAKPGGRYWTKENSLRYSLRSLASQCIDLRDEIPDYVYSAHVHTYMESGKVRGDTYSLYGCTIPSFQFKTGYAIKLFNHKPSDIGLVTQTISADGVASDFNPIMMRFRQTERMKI